MTKTDFINGVSRGFHKVGFALKKHSPEILVVTGVVGTVASAVLACKATTKIDTILDETKHKVDAIHKGVEKKEVHGEKYTHEDSKKDLAIVYAQTGLKFAKLYAPSVLLGAASLGCILTSHNIIRKRNIALAAAYATVDKSFKEYRGRVVERFGEALDRELKYNIKAEEVEETVVNEDGTETKVKKTIDVMDPNDISEYAVFFDDGCKGWEKNAEYNKMFLKQTQNYFNDLLKTRGHVYLNEVYDALGIPRTEAGQIVGWVYKKEGSDGDSFIDFGIWDITKPESRDFVNGRERTILLDFNVDGPILKLMY